MTDELKRDLRLLRLRNFLNPSRFYKVEMLFIVVYLIIVYLFIVCIVYFTK